MTKAQLIDLVQASGNYKTKVEAQMAIKAFTEAISSALEKKKSVKIANFGNFTTVLRKGRSGKVPGADKTYTTHDKIIPRFKAGIGLKNRVASAM